MDTETINTPIYTPEQTKAFELFLRQRTANDIAKQLGLTGRTIQKWITLFNWKALRDDAPVELMLRQRIAYLMWVDHKLECQERELKMLLEQHDKNQKSEQRARSAGQHEGGKPRGRRPNKVKNDISSITRERLDEYREKTFFEYQKDIHKHKQNADINEIRFYLKSRQIGLSFYFAWEAFEDAILSGDNQVFISASKKQAYIFKNYIRKFALELAEVDLKGKDDIELSNGANLIFASTNVATSQGFNGHMYWDEAFWIPRFAELDDYAGGMSIQAQFRTTYISTPSTMAHEAYPKWAGKKEHNIDISHQALKNGGLGVDHLFRQIITVDDAIAKGGDALFNMDKLKRKYPVKEVFDNLLRCKFLDDSASFFALKALLACKADSSQWKDVDHDRARPVGNAEVLVGYDPRGGGQSESADDAGLVVALKPMRKGGVFRFIERVRLKGSSYEQQAQAIRGITEKYNVVYMAMDTSGVGSATAELVRKFYPALIELDYSPEVKRLMAYKSREIINSGRLQFEAQWDDLVHSFLMIRQQTTKVSNQITFVSNRSKIGSHADLAWASMHILRWEPIDINHDTDTTVEFF
ncbi:terminase family protein [uncultured Vibrio sp.]|uniref:terminase large subunit domain-containing protein n=1 Tax=uncultured Vibrio sp. TaxID=114054 RepID=UPI0026393FD5|nr:terminase family protein [uncultured Vibrio sp.]